jgi:DMSO/TMAO reductase YedYZ molybdopterin-dependent catalytic subunit
MSKNYLSDRQPVDTDTNNKNLENPSRRSALQSAITMGAVGSSLGFWSSFALGADEELIPFTDMPEEFAAPPVQPGAIHYLDSREITNFYTENNDFYIIQHYNQPVVDIASYRLKVTGLVDKNLSLSMDDLKAMTRVELDAGFECGGNSPRLFQGLIGNARWAGVALSEVLNLAGVQPAATEFVFYGSDSGEEILGSHHSAGDVKALQNFGRSLNKEEVAMPEIMLAYEMNGEPLPLYHGAPLRLLVPGWYGVANVKWLDQIHVQDRRYMGRFMARDYVTLQKLDIGGVERWEERSVTKIRLKSSIVRVTRRGDEHLIRGFVLNDGTALDRVELSIDGGPWQRAELDITSSRFSWKLFSFTWKNATPGEHSVVSRVIDINGQVQATADEMPEKPTRWENYGQFTRSVMIG